MPTERSTRARSRRRIRLSSSCFTSCRFISATEPGLKLAALLFFLATPGLAASESPDFHKAAVSARQTLEGMVAADTTNPPGNEGKVAELLAARLTAEGIPFTVSEFAPGRKNIVARLKASYSSELKPVLILAHEDVVTASSQKWASDPHVVDERDGYLYGRGVLDDLGMAAVGLETLVL